VIPAAAVAVIEAAHEDARRAHGSTRYAARLALTALTGAGWAVTPTPAATGRQTGAQRAA
jgi:hypothetical protein